MMQTQAQKILEAQSDNVAESNPLLTTWKTPYNTPPFSKIKPEHYLPAFTEAIRLAHQDIDRIVGNKAKPTFGNTILALDRAGELLTRTSNLFFNILECDGTAEMQEIAIKVQPEITKYSNAVYLNEKLFARIQYVYDNEYKKLNGPEKMLLSKTYDAFVNHGANLADSKKDEYRKNAMKLSEQTLLFGQNVLAATNDWYLHVVNADELKGLRENELELAAKKARQKGVDGFVFDLSYPDMNAIMTHADNRDLRMKMYQHSCCKAYNGKYDNTGVIKNILTCRYNIARLLGYKNYAEYALHDRMAKNTKSVYNLLDQLKAASLPKAREEMEQLQSFAESQGLEGPVQRWDFSYYAERQKDSLFKLNTDELRPYFELNSVIRGIFTLANNLYGLSFEEMHDVDVYHPEVKVYKVTRDGKMMAVLYLDFFPRETKRSGAWMTSFREQYINNGKDIRPLVSLVMNFTPATENTPSLLSYDEVNTFLHEFGHALHGMLSKVPYQSISGTNTPRDFVELPSQINENWGTDIAFLRTFAKHYQTGEQLPLRYIAQLENMRKYLAGYYSVRQLSFGYLDMMWHTTAPSAIKDIKKSERAIFDPLDVMPPVEDACMSTSFTHIFSGGYAAGYYSYKWSEMLEADAFTVFKAERAAIANSSTKNGSTSVVGVKPPKTVSKAAQKFAECILSKGGSQDAMEMYVNFRGKKPTIDALLEKSGLK